MNLHLLEDPRNPHAGGVLCTWPSGRMKALQWESKTPIRDSLAMAKELAAKALDSCMCEGRTDDAERTNWASAAAAMQRMVRIWNAKLERRADPGQAGNRDLELVHRGALTRGEKIAAAGAGLAAVGSLLAEIVSDEGGGAPGEGPICEEGGHPPGAPPDRKPESKTGDSEKSVGKIPNFLE